MTKNELEKIYRRMLWVIPGMVLCMIGDYCMGIEPKDSVPIAGMISSGWLTIADWRIAVSNTGGLIGTVCYTLATLPFVDFLRFKLSDCGETDALANIADDIIYLFSPTEIQARLTQFKQLLKRMPNQSRKNLTEHFNEKCLRLEHMKELIDIFNDCRYGHKSEEIVQMVAFSMSFSRIKRRGGNVDNAAWGETITEEEFNEQKEKIGRTLEKRLRNMWQKASKLKFDAIV